MNQPKLVSQKAIATFFLSIFLSSMIFASSGTFITSFYNGTIQYLGNSEDTLIISSNVSATIATSHVPYWLITPISRIHGVISVSPETIAACSSGGFSFFVRGIVPSEFFKNEQLTFIHGRPLNNNESFSIILGYRLANRLHKTIGDDIFLFSALVNDYTRVRIVGIYRSDSLLDDEGLISLSIGAMLSDTYPGYVNLIRIKYDSSLVSKQQLIDALYLRRVLTLHIVNESSNVVDARISLLRYDFSLVNFKLTNSTGYAVFSGLLLNYYFIMVEYQGNFFIYNITLIGNQNLKLNIGRNKTISNYQIRISTLSDGIPITGTKLFIIDAYTHKELYHNYSSNSTLNLHLNSNDLLIYAVDGLCVKEIHVSSSISYLDIDFHRSSSMYYKIPAEFISYEPTKLKIDAPTSLIRSSLGQLIGITENMLWAILLIVALLSLFLIRVITNTFFSEVRRNISVIRMLGAKFTQSLRYILPLQISITTISSILGFIVGVFSIDILVSFDLLLIGGHSYFPVFSIEIFTFSLMMPLIFSLITLIWQIHFVYSRPLADVLQVRVRELLENQMESEVNE